VVRPGDAGRDQQQPDDAHGLLRVVAAVTDAVKRGRDELEPPEPAIRLALCPVSADPGNGHVNQTRQQHAENR
jgi:hypothetical protein